MIFGGRDICKTKWDSWSDDDGRMILLGGGRDEIATRPGDEGRNEEPRGLGLSPMPEPSIGAMVSADKGQTRKDDLHDSRDLDMEQEGERRHLEASRTRDGQEDERGGQEALMINTTSEPSIGPGHSAAKRQLVEDGLLDPDCPDTRYGSGSNTDGMEDMHATRTGQDELGKGRGAPQECVIPEPSTSSSANLSHHVADYGTGVNIANECVSGKTCWPGGKGGDEVLWSDQASLTPGEEPEEQSDPGALVCRDDSGPGEMIMKEEEPRRADSRRDELEAGPSTPGPRVCSYSKGGGLCDIHGPGAKSHWRPIRKEDQMPGPDGKMKTRHYYWVCKLGPKGRGILRQQKLQLSVVRGVRNHEMGDRADDGRKKEGGDSTHTGDN